MSSIRLDSKSLVRIAWSVEVVIQKIFGRLSMRGSPRGLPHYSVLKAAPTTSLLEDPRKKKHSWTSRHISDDLGSLVFLLSRKAFHTCTQLLFQEVSIQRGYSADHVAEDTQWALHRCRLPALPGLLRRSGALNCECTVNECTAQ